MRAGKPRSEIKDVVSAIREICPEMGFYRDNGALILTGNDIEYLASVLDKLARIKNIRMLNKYGTKASLAINISESREMLERIRECEKICVIA